MSNAEELDRLVGEWQSLGIGQSVDYERYALYELVAHSTAIEGSTLTPIDVECIFGRGAGTGNHTWAELAMNADLLRAYQESRPEELANGVTPDWLRLLAARVMRNTGAKYNTMLGSFDAAAGDFRLVNVTAGRGGHRYPGARKVPQLVDDFCRWANTMLQRLVATPNEWYALCYEAHFRLVQIHPWVDGNGRTTRLLMNLCEQSRELPLTALDPAHRALYIRALQEAERANSPRPLVQFMLLERLASLRTEVDNFKHDGLIPNP